MRSHPWLWSFAALAAACGNGDARGTTTFDSAGGNPCVPGEQRACPCPGGAPDGVQVCEPDGASFGPCTGCPGDDSGSSSGPVGSSSDGGGGSTTAATTSDSADGSTTDPACIGHCSNGVQDCGEPFTDCGGDCPATDEYTFCDCLVDTPRNGSEVCDDSGFTVPEQSIPNVLVCLEATGGQIYIANNTSIDPNDNAPRCSGWELMGQNPWDYLDYIVPPLTCSAEQLTQPFDISDRVGETLWFGAHNHPDGGGSGTTACIAIAK